MATINSYIIFTNTIYAFYKVKDRYIVLTAYLIAQFNFLKRTYVNGFF